MDIYTVLIWSGCIFVGVYTDQDSGCAISELYSWKYVEYYFDSFEQKIDAIQNGDYDLKQNIPIDVEVVRDGRIFMTALRYSGVPASWMTIVNYTGDGGGPVLRPYPNWNWTNTSDCGNLVGVRRMAQDECNRLWVLDTGNVDDASVCPPKLLAFDLTTDGLVHRVDIPLELSTNSNGEGRLTNMIIDSTAGTDCAGMNVYMADMYDSGLVI